MVHRVKAGQGTKRPETIASIIHDTGSWFILGVFARHNPTGETYEERNGIYPERLIDVNDNFLSQIKMTSPLPENSIPIGYDFGFNAGRPIMLIPAAGCKKFKACVAFIFFARKKSMGSVELHRFLNCDVEISNFEFAYDKQKAIIKLTPFKDLTYPPEVLSCVMGNKCLFVKAADEASVGRVVGKEGWRAKLLNQVCMRPVSVVSAEEFDNATKEEKENGFYRSKGNKSNGSSKERNETAPIREQREHDPHDRYA